MKTILHLKYSLKEYFLTPSYVASTLLFPSIFYAIFGSPNATEVNSANFMLGSFCCYAVLGVMFNQFGMLYSFERHSPWYKYLKSLPVQSYHLLFSRFLNALFFTILAVCLVILTAKFLTPIDISNQQYLQLWICLLLCAIPFSLMGILLGILCNERNATPISNLVYLPLCFAGGLWMPPQYLPQKVQDLSHYLPTRQMGEIAWAILTNGDIKTKNITYLIVFTLCMATLAVYLYKTEEAKKFK